VTTIVRDACGASGRDPDDLVYSSAQVVCCGENNAEMERRAAAIGRQSDELRQNGFAGSREELRARAAEFSERGCNRVYLQVLDDQDLSHLDSIAEALLT
jgi:alkanesulfonate monooxygenase SsuD/methylene tetrahydromethanopterin reductase-like flavin-dependent oxidoreductase (luciferase family)